MSLRPKRIQTLKELETQERRARSAAWMAFQAVDRSRNAGIKLGQLLGHDVVLPQLETSDVTTEVVQDDAADHDNLASVGNNIERSITPLASVSG